MNLGKTDIPKLEEYWEKYEDMKGQLVFRRYELLYQPEILIMVVVRVTYHLVQ